MTQHDPQQLSPGLFHRPGIGYLLVLNADDDRERLSVMLDGFDHAGVSSLTLHPRSGLLVPYASDEWFEFIQWIVEACIERDIKVWLYDEDPYPSGGVGGRMTAERPEFTARKIVQYVCPDEVPTDKLFRFPIGKLLWCGTVDPATGQTQDLTSRVGVIRERWTVLDPWDSRYYYPATPLYNCPRAMTDGETYAVRVPEIPQGRRLVAYLAETFTGEFEHWEHMPDSLNPDATQWFLEHTHEQYRRRLGQHFGKAIEAIYTDEPKVFGVPPWTPGMFEDFARQFGYDLRPHLWRLFDDGDDPLTLRARLHMRQWYGQRFLDAWVRPVADWCRQYNLPLTGHISPEDDLIQQADAVGNLMPLMHEFALPGIDLIIPAVGDGDHPIINIGIIAARSVCEQQSRPGVFSESLAVSGREPEIDVARRVLAWQTVMGMTTPVVHGAFQSMAGHRAIDAPPDWGPFSGCWEQMQQLGVDLQPLHRLVANARQVAPIAILWPIRSFQAEPWRGFVTADERREAFSELMRLCLDHQCGVHLLDEADLWNATLEDGTCRLGRASYSHLLVPPSTIWHQRTVVRLDEAVAAGLTVRGFGQIPRLMQADADLVDFEPSWTSSSIEARHVADLPRLVTHIDPTPDLRVTAWDDGEQTHHLWMNLASSPTRLPLIPGGPVTDLGTYDVWCANTTSAAISFDWSNTSSKTLHTP